MSKALVLGAAALVFSAAGALAADLVAPGYCRSGTDRNRYDCRPSLAAGRAFPAAARAACAGTPFCCLRYSAPQDDGDGTSEWRMVLAAFGPQPSSIAVARRA